MIKHILWSSAIIFVAVLAVILFGTPAQGAQARAVFGDVAVVSVIVGFGYFLLRSQD